MRLESTLILRTPQISLWQSICVFATLSVCLLGYSDHAVGSQDPLTNEVTNPSVPSGDVQVPSTYLEGYMWPTINSHSQLWDWVDELIHPASLEDPFNESSAPALTSELNDESAKAELAESVTNELDHAELIKAAQLKQEAEELKALQELIEIESKVSQVMAKVIPCVVSIGESGSGVIIKSHGIILTASHVTHKAGRRVQIKMYNGRVVQGITLGSNSANDTSAIQLLDQGPWPYLKTVPLSHEEKPGDWCIAMGYPMSFPRGRPAAIRLGRITGSYNGKIVADCPIMGGDSGGPLIDLNGHLLAVGSSVKMPVTQNMYIPIKRYREDWNALLSSRDIDKMSSTVASTIDNTKPFLGIFGESDHNCVRVRHVHRGSPAESAGLLAEDVINQLDGQPVDDFKSLLGILHKRKPGEVIIASVNRFGEKLELSVKLGKQN